MSFDPTVIPFVVRGVLDPSYGVPQSLSIKTDPLKGLYSYSDGTYLNIVPFGRLQAFNDASGTGILVAGPLNTIFTRAISPGDGSITIENGSGIDDDIGISVTPSTTVQLVNLQANGSLYETPVDLVRINAGANIGVTVDESGFTITGAGGGPSLNNAYVVTEEATDLPESVNLGALTTGLLKNTVADSISTLSRAVPATTLLANDYQAGSVGLAQIAGLSPVNGNFLYFNAGSWTVNSNVALLNVAQVFSALKTFSLETTFTNSIKIPLDAAIGTVLGCDNVDGVAAWTVAGAGDVTLAGANVMTGTTTYNVNLPTSDLTPTLDTELVPKGYVDGLQPLTDTVATTDATPTTLATIAIASNTAVTINGIVAARNSSGTINNTTGGRFTCTAINTAGTVALAATPDVTVQATSTGTFNVVVSGTNLIVQVTGIAATPYTWSTVYTTLAL
jgi:hypothetical protein